MDDPEVWERLEQEEEMELDEMENLVLLSKDDMPKTTTCLDKNDILTLHRTAIDCVSILQDQIRWTDCSSVTLCPERGLRVFATSKFQEHDAFWYRLSVRVENFHPTSSYQLLGRTWRFVADGDKAEEKINEMSPESGVFGKEPILRPGESIEFASTIGLADSQPGRRVKGKLYFENKNKRKTASRQARFEIDVEPFLLDTRK